MKGQEINVNLLKKINSIKYNKLVQRIAVINENHIAI
jgi:hypothetical protein